MRIHSAPQTARRAANLVRGRIAIAAKFDYSVPMKHIKLLLYLLLLSLLALAGCVSSTAVDYERTAAHKFGDYLCFEIDERPADSGTSDIVLSPIVDRRIERALRAELRSKGFRDDCPAPDFRVRFYTVTQTRTKVSDLGVGAGLYRYYPHYSFGGYTQIDIDQYEQGSFIVDIFDAASGELVWRGTYRERLGWSAPEQAKIVKIVRKILANFPPEVPAPADFGE